MTAAEPLDTETIASLETRFGREAFAAMVAHYLGEADTRSRRIAEALLANDGEELRQQAHDLTTSSGTLGIRVVYETAQACELAAKAGERERVRALAAELTRQLEAACAALLERYPELAG